MSFITTTTFASLLSLIVALPAVGQSSSLYLDSPARHRDHAPQAQALPYTVEAGTLRERQQASRLAPAIARASYSAVRTPEPRVYAVHDLITIIIRETTDTNFQQSLETEKSVDYGGEITDFPRINVRDLLNFQLAPSSMDQGAPRLGIGYSSNFEGDGDYSRRDSITGRITARVIDVKPNGTLVLEARKFIQSDEETLEMVLTGTARVDDVTTDNTVLSTELHDLRLTKNHTGELRRTSRKGIFTRVLDTIFNF